MKIRFGATALGKEVRINQCAGCGRVFGGLTGFDKHRKNFQCNDPASLGLSVTSKRTFDTEDGPRVFEVWSRRHLGMIEAEAAIV